MKNEFKQVKGKVKIVAQLGDDEKEKPMCPLDIALGIDGELKK